MREKSVNGPSLTVQALAKAFGDKEATPVEVAGQVLSRIHRLNGSLNCFITILDDTSLASAKTSEERFQAGSPRGLLDGVPMAIKDLIYIAGVRSTSGSKILSNHVASYDSPVTRRLKDSGAVIVGTTNLHEFAAGTTSDNPHYGPVRNPWDVNRVAGGSSGGSAAAVSAGMVPAAIGTDTGGSVRIPAALCGVVGLKPTYGRVTRLGVVPLASSFDTVGTLTNTAWDAAVLLGTLAGHDDGDVSTVDAPVPDYVGELAKPFESMKVGVPRRFFSSLVTPEVESAFDAFLDLLKESGCTVAEIEVNGLKEAADNWTPIRLAEATAFHLKWLRESPGLYGDDVRRLLEQGLEISAVEYVAALNARPATMQAFSESMGDSDVVALPSTCVPAPAIGQKDVEIRGEKVTVRSALGRLCLPFNYLGFPAVSVPAGTMGGLPAGAQLVARPFHEVTLLRTVHAFEGKRGPYPYPNLGEGSNKA